MAHQRSKENCVLLLLKKSLMFKPIFIWASVIVTIAFLGTTIYMAQREVITTLNAQIPFSQNKIYNNYSSYTKEVHTRKKKYAIISVATPTGKALERYNYIFNVPITILAWQRLGFRSIVLISGSQATWESDPCLKIVKQYMDDLNVLSLFMDVPDNNLIMMSQVSRIYAAALLEHKLNLEDYLIISDIDLWPLDKTKYTLPEHKKILILNAYCCRNYTHHGIKHLHVAMGNVGATVKTWRDIMTSRGDKLPLNTSDILNIFIKEFGPVANQSTKKGMNEGWYLDQHMISILLTSWMDKYDKSLIEFVRRKVRRDRLDRIRWSPRPIEGKTDAHVPHYLHLSNNFLKVEELIALMFKTNDTMPLYIKITEYYTDFSHGLNTTSNFSTPLIF